LDNDAPYAAYLWNGAAGPRSVQDFFPAVLIGASSPYTYYAIDAQTAMLLSPGQTPSVTVDDSTGTLTQPSQCSVAGYTVPQQVAR
jgi:hypothetical protein